MDHFIPVAMDTYFRGTAQDVEFCKQIKAGGNHCAAATASGRPLGTGGHLKLREKELSKVLAEYKALPEEERRPALPPRVDPSTAKRVLPKPPAGGIIVRGHCAYLRRDDAGQIVRSPEYYYRNNPDRWPVETQSDMLWLTQDEWTSLIPADPKEGGRAEVAPSVQRRLFSTMAIDYMEGSVNALAPRETALTATVEKVDAGRIILRLDGSARLGKERDEKLRKEPNSRGCEVRVLGYVGIDREKKAIDRFELVGLGTAWGNKMEYVRREMRGADDSWMYGIALELVTTRAPIDLVPPYNMLHYGSGLKYFDAK